MDEIGIAPATSLDVLMRYIILDLRGPLHLRTANRFLHCYRRVTGS